MNNSAFYRFSNMLSLRNLGQPGPSDPDRWNVENMLRVEPKDKDKPTATTVVRIYDEIGFWGINPSDIVDMIEAIDGDRIELRVNSPGGNVFDGIAIMSALMALDKPVDAYVDGIAASIASVFLMSSKNITMPQNTRIMIHDPFAMVGGNAVELRKQADLLDMVKTDIVATYRRNVNISSDKISDMMSQETFISARDAVDMGFAHNFVAIEEQDKGSDNPTNQKVDNVAELASFEAFTY
jgi:ATP-dependent protease ClpP protease subunit